MTCKDCLHFDVCYMIEHYGADMHEENAEHDCYQFKDRSRYVVREKGEWRNNYYAYPECTRCGYMPQDDPLVDGIYLSDFCPNCGSDMRGWENG